MFKKISLPLLAAVISSSAMAGTGSPLDRMLLVEAGVSFSHTFFKGHVVPPESITGVFPAGFGHDPDNHYPNNYWGGYFGLSYYSNCWLLNTRFDIYDSKDEQEGLSNTHISFAPVRLSFSADRVFGNIHDLSYGLGAGVVIENLNKGTFLAGIEPGNEGSHSLDGKSRIDPLVEGFVMKKLSERVGVKLNVAYQIPAHSRTSNGDLNVNLGLNYSFPA